MRTSGGAGGRARHITVADGELDLFVGNPPYSRPRGGQEAWNLEGLSEVERKRGAQASRHDHQGHASEHAGRDGNNLRRARNQQGPDGRKGRLGPAKHGQRCWNMAKNAEGIGGQVRGSHDIDSRQGSERRRLSVIGHRPERDARDRQESSAQQGNPTKWILMAPVLQQGLGYDCRVPERSQRATT